MSANKVTSFKMSCWRLRVLASGSDLRCANTFSTGHVSWYFGCGGLSLKLTSRGVPHVCFVDQCHPYILLISINQLLFHGIDMSSIEEYFTTDIYFIYKFLKNIYKYKYKYNYIYLVYVHVLFCDTYVFQSRYGNNILMPTVIYCQHREVQNNRLQ